MKKQKKANGVLKIMNGVVLKTHALKLILQKIQTLQTLQILQILLLKVTNKIKKLKENKIYII